MGVQRFTWWWVFQHIEVPTGVQSLINKQMMKHVGKAGMEKKHDMVHVARYGQGRAEQGGHGQVDGVKGDSLIRFRSVGKVRGLQGQWEVVGADLGMGGGGAHRWQRGESPCLASKIAERRHIVCEKWPGGWNQKEEPRSRLGPSSENTGLGLNSRLQESARCLLSFISLTSLETPQCAYV